MYTLYVAVGITFYLLTSTQMKTTKQITRLELNTILNRQKELIALENLMDQLAKTQKTFTCTSDGEIQKQMRQLNESLKERIKEIKSTFTS